MDFLQSSPSPYHVVDWVAEKLLSAKFIELREADSWDGVTGKKFFVRRGGKAIIAWINGQAPVSKAGFRIIGAHTDSPVLKPRSSHLEEKNGLPVLDTSVYGSPILSTWLDREFGLAGKIFTRSMPEGMAYESPSIDLRTASLAIHLDRATRDDGLKLNPQNHLNCLVSSPRYQEKCNLVDLISFDLGIDREEVLSFDLSLFDRQPPASLDGNPALICAGRLDNLFSCYCAALSLLEFDEVSDCTLVTALFDSEEIGSRTWNGAQATFLSSTLERVALSASGAEIRDLPTYRRAIASSTFVSMDMAHANHPLYPDRLSPQNAPNLNAGVAIKQSERGHYAMSARLEGKLRWLCKERDVPVQQFRYREDLGGGTSVGPIVAAGLGIEAIDVGAGLLGMHSAREIAGSDDLHYCIEFAKATFFV